LTNEYLAAEKLQSSSEKPDFTEMERLGSGALKRAVVEGDMDRGSMMAGQISGLIKKEETVDEIVQDYVNTAAATYRDRAKNFE